MTPLVCCTGKIWECSPFPFAICPLVRRPWSRGPAVLLSTFCLECRFQLFSFSACQLLPGQFQLFSVSAFQLFSFSAFQLFPPPPVLQFQHVSISDFQLLPGQFQLFSICPSRFQLFSFSAFQSVRLPISAFQLFSFSAFARAISAFQLFSFCLGNFRFSAFARVGFRRIVFV